MTDEDDTGGPPPGDAEPPAGAPPRKLLTRSPRQKIIGGVCGGLGRYFGIDPVIFRVVLAVLALTGGIGLISYGIGWLLIPLDGDGETELRRLLSGRLEGTSMTAVFCALVGSGLFLSTMDSGDTEAFSLSLIAAIVAAVYWSQRRRAALAAFGGAESPGAAEAGGGPGGVPGGPVPVPDAPPAPRPPPTDSPSWWRTPAGQAAFEKAAAGSAAARGRYLWGPADDDEEPAGGRERVSAPGFGGTVRRDRDREGDFEGGLFGLVAFLLAVAAGATGFVAAGHRRPLGTVMEIALTAALGVLGLALVAGSFFGRRGRGVVGWAVVASLLLAVSATVPKSVGTDWRLTTWRPAAASDVRPSYTLGAGQGTLDLTGVALHGGRIATRVEMGAGQIQVRVAPNVTVRLVAKVGLGDVRIPEDVGHAVRVSADGGRTGTFPPARGIRSQGTVELTLRLGTGQVEVLRGEAS